MADSSHALSQRFTAAQLLHLLPAEAARKAVSQNTGLLYLLSWRQLARQQPELALELMRQALETAEKEEVALAKRWELVGCSLPRQIVMLAPSCPQCAALQISKSPYKAMFQ